MSGPAAASGASPTAHPGDKPAVLIIGGLGFIGRFLATYIHTNNLASTLRIVDKQLPQLASLAPVHKVACESADFVQADAGRPQALERIFDLAPHPTTGQPRQFDYVFNCGGETRHSQEDEVYKLRSFALSQNIGKEAARRKVSAYVEISTGAVYNSSKSPAREGDKTSKPHTKLATWKLAAEDELAAVEGLRLVVLRLANVYGPYGGPWLATQLALARVYQSREPKDEMKYLWSADLRTNTIHVEDAARAAWQAAVWRAAHDRLPDEAYAHCSSAKEREKEREKERNRIVFNVVDRGQTTQGTMADIIKEVFGIETGFQNALVNTFARLNLDHVVDDVNDDTLDDWADLQEAAGIVGKGGFISPFMEKEILRDADLSLDGSRFEKVVGFKPEHERISAAEIKNVIDSFKAMNWWP